MPSNPRVLFSGALGLALGLAGGALLPWGQTPPPVETAGPESSAEMAALEEALRLEQQERDALEAELAALRATLADFETAETPPEAAIAPDAETPDPDAVEAAAGPQAGGFDEAALEALDFDASEIRRLRERHEALELERLYLRDQARRERWLNRPRYQRELAALRDEAIDELGEREYDAMLYAAGRNNRVIVSRLLANSPAEAAGIRAGDALLSYDGQRIFTAGTLVQGTAAGRPGSLTELRIERGGEEIRLFLPRGPLGVQLRTGRRPPDLR